jgi:hypothetical protein
MKYWSLCLCIGGFMTAAAIAEVSLQDRYPGLPDTGAAYVTLGADAGNSLATLIIEEAGFRDNNAFGIYDLSSGRIRMLELFEGSDDALQSVQVNFLDGYAWIDGMKDQTITSMGTTFGFYLQNKINCESGTFYSDILLNRDRVDHAAILLSPLGGVIVGFEDLRGGGDLDYNDLIVHVAGVTPIPAPGALLLAGLGTALVLSRRHKIK